MLGSASDAEVLEYEMRQGVIHDMCVSSRIRCRCSTWLDWRRHMRSELSFATAHRVRCRQRSKRYDGTCRYRNG